MSFFLATAMFIQMQAWAVTDNPTAFHESIRTLVSSIPVRFGEWEGTEIKVPQPAARLLRPNALFARRYDNTRTLRSANLVLVHCTDCRDMSGHYPPNCYPASGWTPDGSSRDVELTVGPRRIPAVVYEYKRTEMGVARQSIVYNFFILPSGFATDMAHVQSASGDRRSRPYGAAQVQVILDGGTPEFNQMQIVTELLEPLGPILDTLQVRKNQEGHP